MKSLLLREGGTGPLPHPAAHPVYAVGGRVGERAGAATKIIAAARGAVGTPFRAHGRDARGVDCVGLAAVALRAGGFAGEVPTGYALRRGDADRVAALIDGCGLVRGDGAAGDLLLFASGPGQLHLGIATDDGIVHADALLRRVVERPGVAPWPLVAAWRPNTNAAEV